MATMTRPEPTLMPPTTPEPRSARTVLTTGVAPIHRRTPTGAVLRPLGPFSLAEIRAFVSRWEPTALGAPAPDDPLRFTAVAGDGSPVGFAVTEDTSGDVHVEVTGATGSDGNERAVAQLARMLSLDHDARDYPSVGERLPAVGTLMAQHPGLRPTLFGSPYEAAAWAVISARISMRQAATVHGRIADAHGTALDVAGQVRQAFPGPEALLRVDEVPGLAAEKVRRLHGVAEAALDGRLDLDHLRGLGPAGAREELRGLRGIGPFWASGIWLRACGVVDEFPIEETRCRTALARIHGRGAQRSGAAAPEANYRAPDADITDLVDALRPYRMWTALLLRVAG